MRATTNPWQDDKCIGYNRKLQKNYCWGSCLNMTKAVTAEVDQNICRNAYEGLERFGNLDVDLSFGSVYDAAAAPIYINMMRNLFQALWVFWCKFRACWVFLKWVSVPKLSLVLYVLFIIINVCLLRNGLLLSGTFPINVINELKQQKERPVLLSKNTSTASWAKCRALQLKPALVSHINQMCEF